MHSEQGTTKLARSPAVSQHTSIGSRADPEGKAGGRGLGWVSGIEAPKASRGG